MNIRISAVIPQNHNEIAQFYRDMQQPVIGSKTVRTI